LQTTKFNATTGTARANKIQQAAQITAQSQQLNFPGRKRKLKIYLAKIAQETELKKKQMEVESQDRIAGQTNYAKLSVGQTTADAKSNSAIYGIKHLNFIRHT